jgi:glycosyltransferase involved in cell wall biosynthesis
LDKNHTVELHLLENIAPDQVPIYLNAADVVLLTSRWEGSSNVTKEAMACNTPVVSTDVGDARELFDGLDGYYITQQTSESVAQQLTEAIQFAKENDQTQGRKRILGLGLDEETIAKRLITVYQKLLV